MFRFSVLFSRRYCQRIRMIVPTSLKELDLDLATHLANRKNFHYEKANYFRWLNSLSQTVPIDSFCPIS